MHCFSCLHRFCPQQGQPLGSVPVVWDCHTLSTTTTTTICLREPSTPAHEKNTGDQMRVLRRPGLGRA